MTINITYNRTLENGEKLPARLITQETLAYHIDLVNSGVKYEPAFDFDLPAVTPIKTKPRVSISDSVCISCEG